MTIFYIISPKKYKCNFVVFFLIIALYKFVQMKHGDSLCCVEKEMNNTAQLILFCTYCSITALVADDKNHLMIRIHLRSINDSLILSLSLSLCDCFCVGSLRFIILSLSFAGPSFLILLFVFSLLFVCVSTVYD